MNRSPVTKWVGLLEPIVDRAVAQGTDDFARVSEALRTGRAIGHDLQDGRPERAAFLDYLNHLAISPQMATRALSRWIKDLPPTADVPPPQIQPEAWWYGQLVRLHAQTCHAIITGDPDSIRLSRELAMFVHAEIQPDHATTLPWGLNGLILAGEECGPTAEWVLNACLVQTGGSPDGLALVLLAETLYGLGHVLPDRKRREPF